MKSLSNFTQTKFGQLIVALILSLAIVSLAYAQPMPSVRHEKIILDGQPAVVSSRYIIAEDAPTATINCQVQCEHSTALGKSLTVLSEDGQRTSLNFRCDAHGNEVNFKTGRIKITSLPIAPRETAEVIVEKRSGDTYVLLVNYANRLRAIPLNLQDGDKISVIIIGKEK